MANRGPVLPTLELITKSPPGRMYELEARVLRIGRDRASGICLEDKRVSFSHAQIVRGIDGTYTVEDLKSHNSTFLDGQLLQPFTPTPLKEGSRVKICDFTFVFHRAAVEVRDAGDDGPTILGMLDDLSSSSLAHRSGRSSIVLRAVLEINRMLGGTTELNEVLGRALEELFSIFQQAEGGFILTEEPDGKFSPRATRSRENLGSPLTLSRTVLDHVIRHGQGLIISDVQAPANLPVSESLSGSGIRTALCAPILGRGGRAIGIIQLDTRVHPASFGPEDLGLLAAVAVPIGVVVENHRMIKERAALAAASEVQAALLPRCRPTAPGYTFWERYLPAFEVGGDYYDYIPVETAGVGRDERWVRWTVALGDVSGKGMPAALLMANLSAEVRYLVRSGAQPQDVARQVNEHVFDADLPSRFVTFLLAMIDASTHRLTVVNAGHMGPLVRRASGKMETIGEMDTGMPLGVLRETCFRSAVTTLEPGDVVVLFTDGVNEALNRDDVQFSVAGIERTVAANRAGPACVGEAIIQAVRDHAGGRHQSDDIALICFGRDAV